MSLDDPDADTMPLTEAAEPTLDTLKRAVDIGSGIEGGVLAVTIGDVRMALKAGFSADEVEFMLDLPNGLVDGKAE